MTTINQIIEHEKQKRIKEGKWDDVYEQRLRHELNVIEKEEYTSLLTSLLEVYGKGTCVGFASSSLVCYLVGLTEVDPIKYNLIFERFINFKYKRHMLVRVMLNAEIRKESLHIQSNKHIHIDSLDFPNIAKFKVPFTDSEIFENIYSQADTDNVYMFDSQKAKDVLQKLKPQSFEELILAYTLTHPGLSCSLDNILNAKSGKENPIFTGRIKGLLTDILLDSYGYIAYQEQVVEILHRLAGYPYEEAEYLYRCLSHHKMENIEKERRRFLLGDKENDIRGCKNLDVPLNEAYKVFDTLIDVAPYTFCKSHSAACCAISYKTAWLKHHAISYDSLL